MAGEDRRERETTGYERLDLDPRGRAGVPTRLSNEEGTPLKDLRAFTRKPRPESGLDCLTCAIFAAADTLQNPERLTESGWSVQGCLAHKKTALS